MADTLTSARAAIFRLVTWWNPLEPMITNVASKIFFLMANLFSEWVAIAPTPCTGNNYLPQVYTIPMLHFIIYGLLGWCLEIIWTGIGSLLDGDVCLTAKTYLWMFPIYGVVIVFEPLHDIIRSWPAWRRGTVWMLLYFAVEYSTGWLLSVMLGTVPWDYSQAALNIHGLIRLDYAPAWFVAGLLFEKVHDGLDHVQIYQ